jgi:hypothetical protein
MRAALAAYLVGAVVAGLQPGVGMAALCALALAGMVWTGSLIHEPTTEVRGSGYGSLARTMLEHETNWTYAVTLARHTGRQDLEATAAACAQTWREARTLVEHQAAGDGGVD